MVKVNTVVVMSSKMMVEGELLCVWLEFNLWTYGGVCSTNYRPLNIGQVVFHDWKVHWGSWQVRFYRILFYPKNQVFCMHYSIKSAALLITHYFQKRNQTEFMSKNQPWRNLKKNVKGLIFLIFREMKKCYQTMRIITKTIYFRELNGPFYVWSVVVHNDFLHQENGTKVTFWISNLRFSCA